MKRLKKILLLVLALVLVIPFSVRAEEEVTTIGAELPKVKVYIFEAGGCPWCEKEKDYLKGLDSYNEKFEIVTKELYVDHVDWAEGKDYELGKKVAEAFQAKGFNDAAYTGTPFVVISDMYAAAAYSEDLEGFILNAYDDGDKDIVSCLEENDECQIRAYNPDNAKYAGAKDNSDTIATIILLLVVAGIVAFTVVSRHSLKDDELKKQEEPKEEKKEEKKEEVKKVEPVKEEKTEKETSKTSKKHKKRK